jgi:hypothetical protein
MKRMLNRPAPVPVTLHFLPPLDGAKLDRKQLALETHREIAGALTNENRSSFAKA